MDYWDQLNSFGFFTVFLLLQEGQVVYCSTGANAVQMKEKLVGNQLLHSEPTFLMVQSERIKGCYYPLSKTKLEWYINTIDVTKQVQTEQAKIIQVSAYFMSRRSLSLINS